MPSSAPPSYQQPSKPKKLDLKKVRAIIGFNPHHQQRNVLMNQTRFTSICWGRRSGKTYLAAYIALKYLLSSNHNIWIVAPTYDLARRSWDYLLNWVPRINKQLGKFIKVNKSQFSMQSLSGSKLELKSTDNPSSLLGAGLDMLIIDEAARVPEQVWQTHLRPTLSDRQGKAVFISTPYGKNWFYGMMLKGTDTDPQYKDYSYFHMATRDNTSLPHIKEEVETARLELPANDFMQEYEAEFVEGAGSVFRGVRDCLYDVNFTQFPFLDLLHPPSQANVYQGGLDLARSVDFTVATIVSRSTEKFRVVAVDRFNELDWKIQKPRIALLSQKYFNPPIIAERNNIGDAVIEDLPANFQSFNTTNKSKKDIINNLAILIEQKKIEIPNIPKLVAELEAYSYEVTSQGNIKYSAPAGYHDDMVMSLALACKDLRDPLPQMSYNEFDPPSSHQEEEY